MEQFVSVYTDDIVIRDDLGWPTGFAPDWLKSFGFLPAVESSGLSVLARETVDPDALLLTAAQAAARLGITVEQLLAHVEDGALRYVNTGRGRKKPRYRFSETDLNDFIEERSTLEQPCLSSKPKSPRRTTGSVSKSNVVGFTALRNARLAKKPKSSKS